MSGIVSGLGEMVLGGMQAEAEHKANQLQLERDRAAATAGMQQAQDKGAFEQTQIRAAGGELAAEQRVAYANSGVDASVGTAAEVQANTVAATELDAQQAKNNAAREVWGFRQQKKQAYEAWETNTGNINRKAAGTILGGAGKLGSGVFSLFGGGGFGG